MNHKKLFSKLFLGLYLILFTQLANSATLSATYTNLNSLLFSPSISTPGTGQTTSVNFSITNNTGQTWTDFHFGVGSPFGGNVFFGDLLGTTLNYIGPGVASFGSTRAEFDVIGLNILNGNLFTPQVDLVFGEAPLALIAGNPTIDGIVPPSIPEPSSLLLFSAGLFGFFRKKV